MVLRYWQERVDAVGRHFDAPRRRSRRAARPVPHRHRCGGPRASVRCIQAGKFVAEAPPKQRICRERDLRALCGTEGRSGDGLMASDYEAIKVDNQKRYGTDVGRYGKSLLADLYDDRTHFIYELLQNAEDALRRRPDEPHTRTVRFDLSESALLVSHYGKPFDRRDVEGVCGIALSTREGDLTRIGRFGIGFKSVYGFTDRPEIHSGDEDFGIDSFVWPSAQPAIERDRVDQTVFVMPLRDPEENGSEIAEGLRRIDLDTLLFLREIDSIEWSLPCGESGTCVRQFTRKDDHVRQVTLTGEITGHEDIDQDWLVFSKPMHGDRGELAGHVEVAFLMEGGGILPVFRSPLVVFFPTAVETNLGLRVQGPYRTTPSRDNVPKGASWNQTCVQETGGLLVDALLWLRNKDLLDVDVLQCLPLDRTKFGDGIMFRPLYTATRRALRSKKLLPTLGGGYTSADRAKLGRSSELRKLIDGKQLKQLFDTTKPVSWLTDLISQDRTPELRKYLIEELDVEEVTPQTILPRLGKSFLDRQSDAWMCELYEFLNGRVLLQQAKAMPIVRLSDGTHVAASINGEPQAFLPTNGKTGFPTVRREVCSTEDSRQFLAKIGLSEPHLVDDVIRNVLPKYRENVSVSDVDYADDIGRILEAFQTKESDKREELRTHLEHTRFVRAVWTGDAAGCWAAPNELYLATDRLKTLFAEVAGIKMVDDREPALVGDRIRELLEFCGASRGFLPIRSSSPRWDAQNDDFLARLREENGYPVTSGRTDTVVDWTLRDLDQVLEELSRSADEVRRNKARCIWEELIQLEDRRGKGVFLGEYTWSHYDKYRQAFDSSFVETLKKSAWVPDEDGELRQPALVLFDSLDWRDAPFLLSKIRFKPPIVDQLAAEAGFEPAMLDRLKALGITSVADLEKLGLLVPDRDTSEVESVKDAKNTFGVPEANSSRAGDSRELHRFGGELGEGSGATRGGHGGLSEAPRSHSSGPSRGSPHRARGDYFHSYVAVDHEDDSDPDELAHEGRMALEEAAIEHILSHEQAWQRTPRSNEGFDLVQVADGQECKWCEVKAMTGSLAERPATMSHAQFKCAQEHGQAYWLYVVEQAGGADPRIVKIPDPAGKAKTFTFDEGWLDVAEFD